MGVELVLSLRLPPLHGISVFSIHKALLDPYTDSPRRRRTVVAAEAHSNSEGNSDWKSRGALDKHYHHHQSQHQQLHHQYQFLHQFHPHQHHQYTQHRPWQGSLDAGCQPSGRLGLGFSIASGSDVGEVEKQDSASSFFHNGKCSSFPSKGDHIAINSVCAEGAVAGVNLPLSLRMLKRKQQDSALVSGLCDVGNSLLNAFSSVVSMMKTLQSHTLHIRRQFFEQEIEGLLNQVQREMHVSFIWLFQQVFACTPELMVLLMVLLADFTAFSLVNNVPVQLPTPLYAPPVSIASLLSNNTEIDKGFRDFLNISVKSSPSIFNKADGLHSSNGGWVGNGGGGTYHIAGDADEDPDHTNRTVKLNKALYTMDDQVPTELSSTASMVSHDVSSSQYGLPPNDYILSGDDTEASDFSAMAAALAFEELNLVDDTSNAEPVSPSFDNEGLDLVHAVGMKEIARSSSHLVLDQLTTRSLVAPITARIDDDNYACYDRTDLAYQDAISNDSNNSLLLANYAQFLFLVRKDHDRAEELFRKAVVCDPFDCDAIGRFASFLWLARRNLGAAEKAYQAALRADPANSFHAANYAHFLWNSGL
ncbi:hypothetical protein GOP47_0005568 [Adiantum capillus-veneris]|uniref:Uncharacterized protein n=1 Tax=Adiantum capillus-veneris TaxID=13818 RepID=A0A9D4V5S9_ADICA|nr:hypothetical protein GOP47_0005568 [Adiantum capillus-veneris]